MYLCMYVCVLYYVPLFPIPFSQKGSTFFRNFYFLFFFGALPTHFSIRDRTVQGYLNFPMDRRGIGWGTNFSCTWRVIYVFSSNGSSHRSGSSETKLCHKMLMMACLKCFHNPVTPLFLPQNYTHTHTQAHLHNTYAWTNMEFIRSCLRFSPRRITSWNTWPSCSNQLSPIRRRVIRFRRRYSSGRRTWRGCTANNSDCAATWPRCRAASCPIRRWVMATASRHGRRIHISPTSLFPPKATCQADKSNAINGSKSWPRTRCFIVHPAVGGCRSC